MTTPQTRDDGPPHTMEQMLKIVQMLPDRYIIVERAKWEALESALLSHKQQGRNEGLEEAAQFLSATTESKRFAAEIRRLISPLLKPEETKGENT